MEKINKVKIGIRIFLWILVDIALILAILFIFNILGIIDIRNTVSNMKEKITNSSLEISPEFENFNILDSERLEKQLEMLKIKDEELKLKEKELTDYESELNQRTAKLEEEQKALAEKENEVNKKAINVEERSKTIERLSNRFQNMAPDDAVAIFLEMEDRDLIDIFRVVEEAALADERVSLVPVWISKLPPEKSAQIKRKMLNNIN